MRIEIEPVASDNKSVLRNLLELYEHDATEFNGRDLNEHGLYGYRYLDNYWTEAGRHAYFVRCEDKLAGFALVRTMDSSTSSVVYSMSEFFIVRKYRRKGIGTTVARLLFDVHPGRWEVSQEDSNTAAQEFWQRVIDEYTKGSFQRTESDNGPLLVFDTTP